MLSQGRVLALPIEALRSSESPEIADRQRVSGTSFGRGVVPVVSLAILAGVFSQGAAASGGAHLVAIESFRVSAKQLPARGAPVRLTVVVRNAKRCTFYGQRTAASSLYPLKTVGCSNGRVSVGMPAIVNKRSSRAQLWFQVRVRGVGARTVRRTVIVSEAAAPQAPVPPPTPPSTVPSASLTLTPTAIPATGGTVTFALASTNASSCTLTASPSLWSGANPLSVDCNSTGTVQVPASSNAHQWTVTFSAVNVVGQTASSVQILTQAGPGGSGFATSSNWSGYMVRSSGIVTEVGGSWVVPTLNCAATPNGGVGIWVGIGGSGSEVLLQTGTTSECVNGVQEDFAWTEEYPSNPNHSLPFNSFPVSAGNTITATVNQTSTGSWETRVDNLSTSLSGVLVTGVGWGLLLDGQTTFAVQGTATGLTYAGATTAEWIAEDFTQSGSLVPLADFGVVGFSNLTTSITGWGLTPSDGIMLVDQNDVPLAIPSQSAGNGFTISYTVPS
jgi:hypothetical protein